HRSLDFSRAVPMPSETDLMSAALAFAPNMALVVPASRPLMLPRPAELLPRDWAVFLLQTAAEVEHALMIQYLYAAYSLKPSVQIPGASGTTTDDFSEILTTIAKEEMGHLLTVQNLLRLIGGSPWFERDNFPARTELYPFRFTLERLSKGSLA